MYGEIVLDIAQWLCVVLVFVAIGVHVSITISQRRERRAGFVPYDDDDDDFVPYDDELDQPKNTSASA